MPSDDRIADLLGDLYERWQEGQDLGLDEVLREHPELASDLKANLEMLGVVDRALEANAAVRETALPPDAPPQIGEFRIVREIGRGGMGVVYEAEQVSMGRRVALKVLSPAVTGIGEAVKRFQREARAAGRLHHTNIVPVYGMGEDQGRWYFAMEMVEGRSLGEAITERRERAGEAVDAGRATKRPGSTLFSREEYRSLARAVAGVADALHTVHREGIVHRDVKPTNLLLTPGGDLRLVDFGLAHLEGIDAQMTRTGQLLGTPHYMSPEQAMAKRMPIDLRTDIFSLGATLYEALTLELPFRGDSLPEVCSQIVTKDPVLPRRINSRIPRDLETIVLKAMEKDRDRRYPTADVMAEDLRRFADGVPVLARRIGPLGRSWRRVKRHKVRSVLVASVVLLSVVGGVLALRARRMDKARRTYEYMTLCARAGLEMPRSMDLVALSEFEERKTPGPTSRDIYTEAIRLDPHRYEAWFGRALAPGRMLSQRYEDLEEAEARGLPGRIARLGRAYFGRVEGAHEGEDEGALPDDLQARTPEEAFFLARLLAGENRRDAARTLLTQAIEGAEPGSVVQYLALRYRAALRTQDGYYEDALADLHVIRSPAVGDRAVELQLGIAVAWRRMGNESQAQAEFRAAVEQVRRSANPAQWQRLCAKCRAIGERDWSRIATEAAVAAWPNSSDLLLELALVDVDKRLELCRRAIELDPENPVAWRILSRRLTRLDRIDEAMEAIQRACALDPESAQIRCMLGLKYLRFERYEEAVAAFRAAIERDPRFGNAHKYLGVALERLGRSEEALASYARAIDVHSINPMYHHRRWRLLRRLGHWKQARVEMHRTAGSNHPGPGGHHIRAFALSQLGRYAEGLADVDDAIRTHPRVDFLLSMRAAFLSDLGRLDEALAQFTEAIEQMGSTVPAHLGRATALLELVRTEEALADTEAACRLRHQNPLYPQAARSYCLARLGRFEEASTGLEMPDPLCPYAEDVLRWQALALCAMGRYDEALDRATIVAAWYPEHPCTRIRCLLALGEVDDAMEAARTRIAWEPEPQRPMRHAWLCAVAGDGARAYRVIGISGDPGSPTKCYERAAVYARLGDAALALEWLERAIEGGFRRPRRAPPDPDFADLAEDPLYLVLQERLAGA